MKGFEFQDDGLMKNPAVKDLAENDRPVRPDEVASRDELFYLKRLLIQNTISIDAKIKAMQPAITSQINSPAASAEMIRKLWVKQLQDTMDQVNYLTSKLLELEAKINTMLPHKKEGV